MTQEGIKITVEEWAGSNNISLSEAQIEELVEGIEIAYEMSMPCGYGVGQVQSREQGEIKRLEHQIDMLQRYIESKGYSITLHDDKITRYYMTNYADRSYSQYESFK